jgi:hypothetical protein
MRMIAGSRHAESPEDRAENEMGKLTPELPPMFPKVPPIVRIDGRCTVYCPVLEKAGNPEEQAFGGGPMVLQKFEFRSLGQHQEWNLIEFVTESDGERLKECLIHPMSGRRSMKLIGLLLHADAGSCLDQRIDRPAGQSAQRCATTAWMGERGIVLEQINFALQVDLDDLSIQGCSRKVAGAAFAEEKVKDHPVESRVL